MDALTVHPRHGAGRGLLHVRVPPDGLIAEHKVPFQTLIGVKCGCDTLDHTISLASQCGRKNDTPITAPPGEFSVLLKYVVPPLEKWVY